MTFLLLVTTLVITLILFLVMFPWLYCLFEVFCGSFIVWFDKYMDLVYTFFEPWRKK